MGIEIGQKLRLARKQAELTQEQAAERLGVSRQTVSNWETGKSYPDIQSVVRMSDLYSISLDLLLKEATQTPNRYVKYLDESTNVVKSNRSKGKLILISVYLLIWSFSMLFFWVLMEPSDAGGFALLFLWGLLPVLTFVESVLIGTNGYWGKLAWLAAPILGFAYMMTEFFTFATANHMAFGNRNLPTFSLLLVGTAISAAGLGIGKGIRFLRRNRNRGSDEV